MTKKQAIPGQLPVPRTKSTASSSKRPASIPAGEWPDPAEEAQRRRDGLPSRVVPEVRFDSNGAELPRYRATEPCVRMDFPAGIHEDTGETMYLDRYVEEGVEFYHEGSPPSYYMEPVNQAAIDMTMQHPPGEHINPVELLPI